MIYAIRLDIDARDYRSVMLTKDLKLDGSAPTFITLDPIGIFFWFLRIARALRLNAPPRASSYAGSAGTTVVAQGDYDHPTFPNMAPLYVLGSARTASATILSRKCAAGCSHTPRQGSDGRSSSTEWSQRGYSRRTGAF